MFEIYVPSKHLFYSAQRNVYTRCFKRIFSFTHLQLLSKSRMSGVLLLCPPYAFKLLSLGTASSICNGGGGGGGGGGDN
jgi:hypothetical protein